MRFLHDSQRKAPLPISELLNGGGSIRDTVGSVAHTPRALLISLMGGEPGAGGEGGGTVPPPGKRGGRLSPASIPEARSHAHSPLHHELIQRRVSAPGLPSKAAGALLCRRRELRPELDPTCAASPAGDVHATVSESVGETGAGRLTGGRGAQGKVPCSEGKLAVTAALRQETSTLSQAGPMCLATL